MKKYILIFIVFYTVKSYAQLRTPAQSPLANIKQSIGLTDVEITYSRPSARNRIIFGEDGLLRYNEFWRLGANAATKISFNGDVSISGKVLKKGSYTLLGKPGATTWELNWYAYEDEDWNSYVEKEPILSQKLTVYTADTYVETMELHFQDVTMDSGSLLMEWENTRLKIQVSVDETEKILKAITRTLVAPSASDYYRSALYLHETETDLEKALVYIQKITILDTALFFQVTREAMILKDLKRNKEAIEVANRALALSIKVGNDDFIRINKKIIEQQGF